MAVEFTAKGAIPATDAFGIELQQRSVAAVFDTSGGVAASLAAEQASPALYREHR